MMEARQKHAADEAVMRGEFDQIARNLALRVEKQRSVVKQLAAAHRPTREEKRKLAVLAKSLERIHALRSQLA